MLIISVAARHGVSLIHGNAQTFYGGVELTGKELSFQLIFQFWRNLRLGEDNLVTSLNSLRDQLAQLQEHRP